MTSTGSSPPSDMKMRAGFWFGLQPYFNSNSFILSASFLYSFTFPFLLIILLRFSPVTMSM